MKLIVAGSRTFHDYRLVKFYLEKIQYFDGIQEIISGGAQGADKLGEEWALSEGIHIKVFSANWKKHGRAAGPIRNQQMAEYADCLIAFWDGKSRGTADMIKKMKAQNKYTLVIKYKEEYIDTEL